MRGFLSAVFNLSHFAQVNRFCGEDSHDDISRIIGVGQEASSFNECFRVLGGQTTGNDLAVRSGKHRSDICDAKISRSELCRVQQNSQLAACTANDCGFGDQGDLFDRVIHLRHQAAQGQVVILRTVKCQGENRHVVDGPRLDHWKRDAPWNPVKIGLQLLIELNKAVLDIFTDLEAHNSETFTRFGSRVYVFDPWNFPKQLFHGACRSFLDLLGAEAGHRYEYVNHRNLDLRLLLAREHDHRCDSKKNRGDDNQRSKL